MINRPNPAPANAAAATNRIAELRTLIAALGNDFLEAGLIDLAQDAYTDAGAKNGLLAVADHRMREGKLDVAFDLCALVRSLD
jgi:hypothetical protein